jgi:ParB family chromosome partitioning protein
MPGANKDALKKPSLKNIDYLFGLDSSNIHNVEIDKLIPFSKHPFRLYEGERLDDMVESIKANGVLIPIIVRKAGEMFEILAGHNRMNAAKIAGLETIPSMILDGISDEEALVYVVETNLIQRSFSDMSHTEKATVIALHHSKMFSQGKRNDIIATLKMLEHSDEYDDMPTSSQIETKLRTDEKIGESYGLSRNTIARYLRIQHLIQKLKSRLDRGELAFISAVALSFLKEYEQMLVDDCMERNNLTIDIKKANMLKRLSESESINGESVYRILSGETSLKPIRKPIVKVNPDVYIKYFKPEQTTEEIQEIVEKALEMYFGYTD